LVVGEWLNAATNRKQRIAALQRAALDHADTGHIAGIPG
jgi:hypothetical protein